MLPFTAGLGMPLAHVSESLDSVAAPGEKIVLTASAAEARHAF